MLAVLPTVLPLFALIAAGFAGTRTGYVPPALIAPVTAYAIRVAMPAMVFDAVTSVPVTEALNPGFMAAYAGASLAVLAAGMAVGRAVFALPRPQAAIMAMGMACSNSGFMGYPVALGVVGPAAAPLLAQCMLVENVLMFPVVLALTEAGGRSPLRSALAALAGLARNPMILALAAALALSASGLALPAPLAEAVAMLARTGPTIALLIIGATIAALPLAGVYGMAGTIAAGKLVLHPAAVLAALSLVPGLDPVLLHGGVVFAAVPMLSIYPIFGERAGLRLLAAAALLAATIGSFATLPAVLALTGPG
ncbi:MAG: AEC family transporter [Rhodobacteraceae bacterium]|jgi:predicted permease|nr:AEC family transporter [Paracoccaceae bacterium]